MINSENELTDDDSSDRKKKGYISEHINKAFDSINNRVLEPVFVGEGRKESKDFDLSSWDIHNFDSK